MQRMGRPLNLEFDSRILRTSVGFGGVIRPHQRADYAKAVASGAQCPHCPSPGPLEKLHCLNCGREGSAITADLPMPTRAGEYVGWTCPRCDGAFGTAGAFPIDAFTFADRR